MITFLIGFFGVIGFAILTSLRISYDTLYTSETQGDLELKDIGLSLIIPARNEEKNLPKLFMSIQNQSIKPYEVIIVDDSSEDKTAQISADNGFRVVEALIPANDIKPKVNAMHRGFMHSSGDVVVFLDADVELKNDFVEKVTAIFSHKNVDVLSIQPFHASKNLIGLFSMFFHCVSLIGSGLFSMFRFRVGLFGPCIALRRESYLRSEGFNHKDVRNSVVEDVALEKVLSKDDFTMIRLMGKDLIDYEMYNSFKEFFVGWRKNISTGAKSAPIWVFGILVAYLGFLVSAPLHLVIGVGAYSLPITIIYVVALFLLLNFVRAIGNYAFGVLIYPICLLVFFFVFIASLFSMVFRRKVSWKGRSLKL